ncbi:MAG: serine hydrolase domain-containing protein, partial [Candidatus Limnocylindrales bacterium]
MTTGLRPVHGMARGPRWRPAVSLLLALVVGACGSSQPADSGAVVPAASATASGSAFPTPTAAGPPTVTPPTPTATPTPSSPAGGPGDTPPSGPTPSLKGLDGTLQAQLASAVRRLHLPGVQATIALADGETWSGAAGIADQRTGRLMTTADVFDVGSITKTFVAADVMRLVESGAMQLDDPLSRWLPRYPNAAHITLRELLSHTSGIADYFANGKLLGELGAAPRRTWLPAALLPFVGKAVFPPGKGWSYSNTNFLLLGEVVEAATGRPLGDELGASFLAPLGLRATALQAGTLAAPAPDLGPLAHPYQRVAGAKVVYRDLGDGSGYLPFTSLATALGSAGSMVSTSSDLARWGLQLYGGRLLQPGSLVAMEDTAISASYHPAFDYGLGTQALAIDTFPSYGHGGACSGYRADLR